MQLLSKLSDLSLKYEDSTISLYAPIHHHFGVDRSVKVFSFKAGRASKAKDLFLAQVGVKSLRILNSGVDDKALEKILCCPKIHSANVTHLSLDFFFHYDLRSGADHMAEFVGCFPNLISVDLSHLFNTDITPIVKSLAKNCQILSHIDISEIKNDGIPQEAINSLLGCVNLTSVRCNNALYPANTLNLLATLPKLADLELRDAFHNTRLKEGEEEDLNGLASSKSLKRVFYSRALGNGTLKMDKLLQARKDLLAINSYGDDIDKLSDQLEEFTINNPISLKQFDKLTKKCKNIASLDVQRCTFSEKEAPQMPQILANLPETLSTLKIGMNPDGVARFAHLHTLAVIFTTFPPGTLALILSKCVQLRDLNLNRSNFENKDFTALPKDTKLETLDLSNTNVDLEGIKAIAERALCLERLILVHCKIDDKAIDDLLIINPPLLTLIDLEFCSNITTHAIEAIYRSSRSHIRQIKTPLSSEAREAFISKHPDYTKRFDYFDLF